MSDEKNEKKKDLTGILELSSLMPPAQAQELLAEDAFQVNTEQAFEQIDDFSNLDDMGMMDHVQATPQQADASPEQVNSDPIAHDFNADSLFPTLAEDESLVPPGMDEIKDYSERSRESPYATQQRVSFHLWMNGKFDPFARDKLLLFINDNPIGLNSMELDRQINASRVMFPRISEFAGIKLIQDLRDCDLSFKLLPSSRDEDEVLPEAENLRISLDFQSIGSPGPALTIIPDESIDQKLWLAFDSIHLVQFLKAEILEVERSDLFQNLIDRMLISLKRKAEIKGATAIGQVKHELKSLRLPSQYQVELRATLYKKL